METKINGNLNFTGLRIKNYTKWLKQDSKTLTEFLDSQCIQRLSSKYNVKADYCTYTLDSPSFGKAYRTSIEMKVKPLKSNFFTKPKKITLCESVYFDTIDSAQNCLRELIRSLGNSKLENECYMPEFSYKNKGIRDTIKLLKQKLKNIGL